MELLKEMIKRKRFHVTIEGNGEEVHLVVIAYDSYYIKEVVRKYYNHLITDDIGNETGKILYKESELV
jgi:hypothetical protein